MQENEILHWVKRLSGQEYYDKCMKYAYDCIDKVCEKVNASLYNNSNNTVDGMFTLLYSHIILDIIPDNLCVLYKDEYNRDSCIFTDEAKMYFSITNSEDDLKNILYKYINEHFENLTKLYE